MAGKTLETHFREQAELFDRLSIYRFEEFDKKWDAKIDVKLEAKLEPLRADLETLTNAVLALVARLP